MNGISVPQREYPAELIQQRAYLYSLLPSDDELIYIVLIGAAALLLILLLMD